MHSSKKINKIMRASYKLAEVEPVVEKINVNLILPDFYFKILLQEINFLRFQKNRFFKNPYRPSIVALN